MLTKRPRLLLIEKDSVYVDSLLKIIPDLGLDQQVDVTVVESFPPNPDLLNNPFDLILVSQDFMDAAGSIRENQTEALILILADEIPAKTEIQWADGFLSKMVLGKTSFLQALQEAMAIKLNRTASLEKSERIRRALEGGKLAWWDYDIPADEIKINYLFDSTFGSIPEEMKILFKDWIEFLSLDEQAVISKKFRDQIENRGGGIDLEFRAKNKKGHTIWFLVRGRPIEYDSAHHPVRINGTLIDITHWKKNEEEFKLSKKRLELLYRLHSKKFNTVKELLDYVLSEVMLITKSTIYGSVCLIENDPLIRENSTGPKIPVANQLSISGEKVLFESIDYWSETVNTRKPVIWEGIKQGDVSNVNLMERYLAIPILENESVAAVICAANKAEVYEKEDVLEVQLYFDEAWKLLTQKKMEESLIQRVLELEAVEKISKALRIAQSQEEMLPLLLEEILGLMDTNAGAILMYDSDSQLLNWVVESGWWKNILHTPISPREGISGRVYSTGKPYVSKDMANDPILLEKVRKYFPAGWGGVGLPIRNMAEIIGVLYVSVPLPREIQEEEVRVLSILTEIAGNAIRRVLMHENMMRSNADLQKEISQRKEIQVALAKDREVNAITLSSIGDGVISTDPRGIITVFNRAAESITGYLYEEAVGKPLGTVLRFLDHKTGQIVSSPIEYMLEMEKVEKVDAHYRHPILIVKDGRKAFISGSISPIYSKSSVLAGYATVFQNITEKIELESQAVLSQKMEAIGQLAAGICP